MQGVRPACHYAGDYFAVATFDNHNKVHSVDIVCYRQLAKIPSKKRAIF
jgi:hypothetical protein